MTNEFDSTTEGDEGAATYEHVPGPRPLRRLVGRWMMRPRPSLRLRLTFLYGSMFLVCGVALLGTTYLLVDHATSGVVFWQGKGGQTLLFGNSSDQTVGIETLHGSALSVGITRAVSSSARPAGTVISGSAAAGGQRSGSGSGGIAAQARVPVPGVPPGKAPTPKQAEAQFDVLRAEALGQHNAQMRELLLWSAVALAFGAVLSAGLGWLLAGRALRPIKVMTSTARAVSSTNLRERIGLEGPNDELKELGDTFDELLGRLEQSFEAQRQFIANASHELRTPLARQRTMLEVALDDDDTSLESMRDVAKAVLAAGEEQERLVEELLTLAASERGLEDRPPLDLGVVTAAVATACGPEASTREVEVRNEITTAPILGSEHLVSRLVANLLDNALRYNEAAGWVEVSTSQDNGRCTLRVTNSGPVVSDDDLDRLLRPFERATGTRTARDGHGIGLSIVAAVCAALDANLDLQAPPSGGLDITVSFPAAPTQPSGVAEGHVST